MRRTETWTNAGERVARFDVSDNDTVVLSYELFRSLIVELGWSYRGSS